MTWSTRFRVREYVRGSLWIAPVLAALLGGAAGSGAFHVDRAVGLPSFWEYSPSTATAVLAAIVGALAALTGFVITVTVLVVQMATGTFSARYMRLWYRDRLLKATLAVLVGTLTFALELLRRVEADFVPNLGVTLAGLLVIAGLLQILDYLGGMLQRIGTTDLVAGAVPEGGRAPGVALRMRRWDDFLALGVTEIRQYGATSIQVMRRLRAMLEELDDALLPAHRAAVEEELRRLDATVAEHWGSSVDLDRASAAGRQGIGGPSTLRPREDP